MGGSQRVKKVHVIPREQSDRGNPFPKSSGLSEKSEKSKYFGERIATPACALARNDRFFDSLTFPKGEGF